MEEEGQLKLLNQEHVNVSQALTKLKDHVGNVDKMNSLIMEGVDV